MKINLLRFLFLLLFFYAVGCATTGKRAAPYKRASAEDCYDFDEIIHSCAKTAKHSKLFLTLRKIAHCETGNKCTGKIDSPNGLYHGAFQYASETWSSVCEPYFTKRGMTQCENKEAVYDVCCATICAAEMISSGGIGNWPTCGL